jgi:hypothetical protein
MSALVKPVRMLKSYIGGQALVSVEASRTVREVVTTPSTPPEIVALVPVNDAQQSKDYLQAELKAILSDSDAAKAPRFLKKVVWAQVQAIRRKELRRHLEQGQG